MNNLEEMNRKELQALAKQHGIKANLSNAAIIDQLMPILGATAAAEVDEVPEVESVVVAPVVEIVPEPVQVVESKVEARKSILVFEEAPGPFTIPHQEVDSIPQATASVDDAQVGDVIEVLEAGEWQPATIKRVNKVSFRVSLQSTGREVTVKMTDARMIVTISNEAEVEVESAVKTPIEDAPEEMENEVEATEEVDGIEDHASEDEEDVTIPDEELMAALMDDDEEEEQEEEGEAMDEEYDEEEIDDMAAAEDIIAPSQARKSACQKRTSSMLLGATPKKARTSELPIWNSSTKSDSYSFDVGAAPASAKKAPGSIRKSFANAATPNPNKPAIVPKMNMTQKLRMEALQKQKNAPATNPLPKKSTPLVGNKVTPIVAKVTPLTAKISSVVSKTLSEKQNKVQFNFTERVKTAPTPSSVNSAKPAAVQKKSSTTPNFNRMHQKQFNNSKPITSCVERNHDVAKKMEAAFALANAGTYKEEAKPKAIAKPQNLVKSVASKSSNLETKKSSFIKDTANKENTTSFNSLLSSSTSNVVVNASRVGAKEASSLAMSAKKEQRRETYAQDSKVKREAIVNKRRSAVECTAAPSNPFENLVSKTPSKKALPFY